MKNVLRRDCKISYLSSTVQMQSTSFQICLHFQCVTFKYIIECERGIVLLLQESTDPRDLEGTASHPHIAITGTAMYIHH
jgi:hypothetical protein